MIAVAAGALMAAMVPGVTTAAADGGNSENAKACQKGGWKNLLTGAHDRFSSAGDCVSYAAQGGRLFAPELTFNCSPGLFYGTYQIWWTGIRFTPDSTGVARSWSTLSFDTTWAVTTDADGDVYIGWSLNSGPAAANGSSTSYAEFTDGTGLFASLTVQTDDAC